MPDNLLNLAKYDARSVSDHFMIAAEDDAARRAINFVFRMIHSEQPKWSGTTAEDINHITIAETIERIAFRYNLYTNFVDSFPLFDKNTDYDAMVTALICDYYIEEAEAPVEDDKEIGNPARFLKSGMDFELVHRASLIHDNVNSLEAAGHIEEGNPTPEEIFLAHIRVFDRIHTAEKKFEESEADIEFLQRELFEDIEPLWKFFRIDSEIGEEMHAIITQLRKELKLLQEPENEIPSPANDHIPTIGLR